MRQLTDRELDLLVNGPNSLASSWLLRSLKAEIRRDPWRRRKDSICV